MMWQIFWAFWLMAGSIVALLLVLFTIALISSAMDARRERRQRDQAYLDGLARLRANKQA